MNSKYYKLSIISFVFLILIGVISGFGNASTLILNDNEAASINGSGNCYCYKATYCGSVYCEWLGSAYYNCSGSTSRNFCAFDGNSSSTCYADGLSIPCGVYQACTSYLCGSCTATTTSCSRTSTSTRGYTPCP